MMTIPKHFQFVSHPIADPAAIVAAPGVRFSVLTSRLIRMEYAPDGASFEDRPSQVFWHRRQPLPDYRVTRAGDELQIETAYLRLRYDAAAGPSFNAASLSVELPASGVTWRYGDPDRGNLLGTTRTLDQVSGQTRLEPGLLSRDGWVVWDDMRSLLFNEQGWLETRPDPNAQDLYFFGYGHDYADCLRDFSLVAGKTPLLPRWVLGNWWSRYWEYSQEELIDLMRDFRRHYVPLSVCIIDMDWHITNTGNDCSGWTGYTWNRQLFPDPPALIRWLHNNGLRTALNLHPAEGVHNHEGQYEAMAQAMGRDPSAGAPIPFDLADPNFALPYFSLLHHPLEAEGVDFWWLDWQQGRASSLPGLDPLWWLNHLHYFDLGRDGSKRPFIFSRWGGLGNNRYPIGFSGDTFVNWESLAFQPYFTATAANVGYGWWSHDIGGHTFGMEEAELYLRWVQFGVFSPILRLHCTKNPFHERRPWGYDAETMNITRAAMQLRHALIPYLYTLSRINSQTSTPPIRPMYHDYPAEESAYNCPDQYTFGPSVIAAPFTERRDPHTQLSRQVVWFPPGDWCDLFSGQAYAGGRWQAVYGDLKQTPVFARPGAIIPLSVQFERDAGENPDELELLIFPGADGQFTLYEDDGSHGADERGVFAETLFAQQWSEAGDCTFTIGAVQGDWDVVPPSRTYTLRFRGIQPPAGVTLMINDMRQEFPHIYNPETNTLSLELVVCSPFDMLTVTLSGVVRVQADRRLERCREMLRYFRLETGTKASLLEQMPAILADPSLLANYVIPMQPSQMRALLETITEAGMTYIDHAGADRPLILWNNNSDPGIAYQLNTFHEIRWYTHRVYRPETGMVPATHILHGAELDKSDQWKLTFHYGPTLTLTVDNQRT